jgi:hypothetical protein
VGDVVEHDGREMQVTQSCADSLADWWCLAFDHGALVHFPAKRSFVRVREGQR